MDDPNSTTFSAGARAYTPPNYTQVPNEFFDEILPEIESLAELKVTLAIFRQTFGWHKEEDRLSLSQLEELTGLHRETVSEGIKKALQRGFVGRKKQGNGYVYGLRVASRNIRPPADSGSRNIRPSTSREIRPTKETEKESVEANASRAKPSVIGLEKHITDLIYEAMREAGYRLPNEHFTFHLGRAKDMLAKDDPTNDELDALPAAFVALWEIRGKADAPGALVEMRRQKGRERRLAAPTPLPGSAWERGTPPAIIDYVFEHTQTDYIRSCERRLRSTMARFDFTSEEQPPWKIEKELGGTENERWAMLDALRSLCRRGQRDGGAGAA